MKNSSVSKKNSIFALMMTKRFFCSLALWSLIVCSTWAQSETGIVLKEGSVASFRQGGDAVVLIDYSKAEFGKENIYEEYQSQMRKVLTKKVLDKAIDEFCVQFNYQNQNGLQVQAEAEGATHRLLIQITRLNEGSMGGVLNIDDKTAGGAKISGEVSLTDLSSDKILCSMEFTDISSDSKVSKKARIAGAFEELGFQLGRMVK